VHRAYPVIHLAGTNGKTSTARMIESILRTLGLRTGLFTSPHLISLNERIHVDGEPISDETLVANWVDIKPYVEMVDAELLAKGELRLTFFEVLTILGFAVFADAPVDVAVVEAGMGGEWDATNVADGVVSVFTPVALDHTERLGKDIETIARTKSGIIKPAAMVVSAPQEPEAETVLREAADLTESTINVLGTGGTSVVSEVAVGGQLVSIIGLAGTYDDLFVALLGDHQAVNAAVAVMAVESFLGGATHSLDKELLAQALATVTSPGRLSSWMLRTIHTELSRWRRD
jgi:dihydrofolate synthase/folylpolyglutamate synthase